ncbi:hypothetical protein CmeUKMEL1_00055 [Cryptosporidium meleagridis]|uniref:Uncharacterized protein n=1 Tax=Cryptosporidium meleagridis TaxID=93969 RepID=A0A2P4YVZ2_9CRYT|nr:hypothetical protein CmeUKMEL1_00055 [Cryptosporidium meleagridis]
MSELRREELIISDIPALLKEEMIEDDKDLCLELILDSEIRNDQVSDNCNFGSNEEFNLLSIFKDDNTNTKNNEQLDGQKDPKKDQKEGEKVENKEQVKDKKKREIDEAKTKEDVKKVKEKDQEKDPKEETKKDQEKDPKKETKKDQEKDPKKETKKDQEKDPKKETKKDQEKDPKKETKKDQEKDPKKETKKDQEKDPKKEIKKDQEKDPKKETKKDKEKDPKKETKKGQEDSKKDQKNDLKKKLDKAKIKDEKDKKKDTEKEIQKKDSSSQNKAKHNKEAIEEDEIIDSESDHQEKKNPKAKKDSSLSSKFFKIKIPYREASHIPSCLFEQDNTNDLDFNRIKNYNEYIHETSRVFSVDSACRYVFIKRISKLDNAIQNVINEGWNAFACTKDDKDFEDLMATNISEKLLEDYDLTANTEKIQGYEPLNLPKTRITFHANPITLNNEQILSKKNDINKDIIFD